MRRADARPNDAISAEGAASKGPDRDAAEAACRAVHDQMWNAIDTMTEIRAQSVRGLTAKARVADLIFRTDGVAHGEGPQAWMVVDDLLDEMWEA
jgi:hypothetical protein